ncbi:transmembrane protein 242 isoform X1 [Syngnathus acus]|uniref:transmembrane protein 242 isoform X1 n=1 Tax=Syngnathus acus TaxID=161584 RepID=UPI001885D336|nr:transmembrane protein 242 isoform X1 [Syngnathus acus]
MLTDQLDMSTAEKKPVQVSPNEDDDKLQLIQGVGPLCFRCVGAVFLAAASSLGLIAGFGSTLALAKKNNPDCFSKGGTAALPESGGALALRALGRGSAYACLTVGVLSLGACKLLGVGSLSDLRRKMALLLPPIPRSEAAPGSDSSNLDSLFRSK